MTSTMIPRVWLLLPLLLMLLVLAVLSPSVHYQEQQEPKQQPKSNQAQLLDEDEERDLLMLTLAPEDDPTRNNGDLGFLQVERPASTVRLRLDLSLGSFGGSGVSNGSADAEFESFICHLAALYTDVLGLSDTIHLDHGKWMRDDNHADNTILIVDAYTPEKEPEQLLDDLQATLGSSSTMNDWLSAHYNEQEPYAWHSLAAVVTTWQGKVVKTPNRHFTYFSSDNCGVARVTLFFSFFDNSQLNNHNAADYEQTVDNLLCSSELYFATLFDQLYHFAQETNGNKDPNHVHVLIDKMDYTHTPGDDKPLVVHFDLRVNVAEREARRIPARQALSWMEISQWEDYIQEAVWEVEPYKSSIFYQTKIVNFHGEIRPLMAPLPEGALSDVTTERCVDGIMLVPPKEGEPTRGAGGQLPNGHSHRAHEITSWNLNVGFQDHFASSGVAPSMQTVNELFCQVYFQYNDMLKYQRNANVPAQQAVAHSQSEYHVVQKYTDLTLKCYDWSYNAQSEYPLQLKMAADAHMDGPPGNSGNSHHRVDPSLLWDKIQANFNIQSFFSNYVWPNNPNSNTDYLYHADEIKMDGGIIDRAVTIPSVLESDMCHRTTNAPSVAPPSTISSAQGMTITPPPPPQQNGGGDNSNARENGGAMEQRPNNNNNGAAGAQREPTKSSGILPISTSVIAVHLPKVMPSKQADDIQKALQAMLTEMIQDKPRRGVFHGQQPVNDKGGRRRRLREMIRKLQRTDTRSKSVFDAQGAIDRAQQHNRRRRRRRRLFANVALDSVTVVSDDMDENQDCAEYYGQDQSDDLNGQVCSKVPIVYDVYIDDENKDEVEHEFLVMTQVGITRGTLQEKLAEVNPESGLTLVPDPSATAEIAGTVFSQHPPPTEAPTYDAKPRSNSTNNGPEGWVIALMVLLLLGICCTTSMILYNQYKFQKRQEEAKFLTNRELSEGSYRDVI